MSYIEILEIEIQRLCDRFFVRFKDFLVNHQRLEEDRFRDCVLFKRQLQWLSQQERRGSSAHIVVGIVSAVPIRIDVLAFRRVRRDRPIVEGWSPIRRVKVVVCDTLCSVLALASAGRCFQ